MKKKNKKIKRKFGLTLCVIQGLATLIFIIGLFVLNLLPIKYVIPIIILLVLLWILPFLNQLLCKKKMLSGKILSISMTLVLTLGAFYVIKTHGMVNSISGGDKKVDKMVVAVLVDDPAEKLKDAAEYDFGVQYALKGNDVKDTIEEINSKLKKKISVVECHNLNEQARALHDGEVQAIIYNDAYTSVLEESFEGFSKSIKIIYSHEIVSKLDNMLSKKDEMKVSKNPFTVYLSGIDVEGAIETTGRSDVNILAVVNPKTYQILLITTPRDYYVELPGISMGMNDKLTHAGIYGVAASMAALSQLYDTPVDFYARVNFTSLPQIVDALGGIDVNSEYEFETHPDSGQIMYVKEGMNHFDGAQALVFSRERQNIPGGDYQRGKNQQAVITAMIKRAVSPAILAGASEIIDSVSANVDTNMSSKQIQSLIKSQISSPHAWNIKSMAATGEGMEADCFSVPGLYPFVCVPDDMSVQEIKDAIDQVINGETLTESEVVK